MSATKPKQRRGSRRPTQEPRPKRREITFISPSKELRIVRVPTQRDVVNGMSRTIHPGVHYVFGPNGQAKVWEGDDAIADGPRDEYGEPVEQDAVEFLRRHAWHGDKFWEVGSEPGVARPTLDELVPRITAAAAGQDRTTLRAIREQEVASHRRASVLSIVDASLKALGEQPQPVEPAQGTGFPQAPTAEQVETAAAAPTPAREEGGPERFSSAPDQPHEPIGAVEGDGAAILGADD